MEFLSALNKTNVRQESSLKVFAFVNKLKHRRLLNSQCIFTSETICFTSWTSLTLRKSQFSRRSSVKQSFGYSLIYHTKIVNMYLYNAKIAVIWNLFISSFLVELSCFSHWVSRIIVIDKYCINLLSHRATVWNKMAEGNLDPLY